MWTIYLFIYFWSHWIFVAALRGGAQASHYGGFSSCRAQAPGTQGSVVAVYGLSSCRLQALVVLEHRLSSWGTWA